MSWLQLFALSVGLGLFMESLVMCMSMVKDGMPTDDVSNSTDVMDEEF